MIHYSKATGTSKGLLRSCFQYLLKMKKIDHTKLNKLSLTVNKNKLLNCLIFGVKGSLD
jgi:hypothetical protein